MASTTRLVGNNTESYIFLDPDLSEEHENTLSQIERDLAAFEANLSEIEDCLHSENGNQSESSSSSNVPVLRSRQIRVEWERNYGRSLDNSDFRLTLLQPKKTKSPDVSDKMVAVITSPQGSNLKPPLSRSEWEQNYHSTFDNSDFTLSRVRALQNRVLEIQVPPVSNESDEIIEGQRVENQPKAKTVRISLKTIIIWTALLTGGGLFIYYNWNKIHRTGFSTAGKISRFWNSLSKSIFSAKITPSLPNIEIVESTSSLPNLPAPTPSLLHNVTDSVISLFSETPALPSSLPVPQYTKETSLALVKKIKKYAKENFWDNWSISLRNEFRDKIKKLIKEIEKGRILKDLTQDFTSCIKLFGMRFGGDCKINKNWLK